MTDISFKFDPISDFPLVITNPLAVVNSFLAFEYVHGTYPDDNPYSYTADEWQAALQNEDYQDQFNDNTLYITIPPKRLPLLEPWRDLGAATGTTALTEPLALLVEPTLTVLIDDLGYDRTISPGEPTRARLFPTIRPVELTENLVAAAVKGVEDAVGAIGTPAVGTPTPTGPVDTSSLAAAGKPAATPPVTSVSKSSPVRTPKVTLTTPFNRRADESKVDAAATQTGSGTTDKPTCPKPLKTIARELQKVADSVTKAFDRPDTKPADTKPADTKPADTKDEAA